MAEGSDTLDDFDRLDAIGRHRKIVHDINPDGSPLNGEGARQMSRDALCKLVLGT